MLTLIRDFRASISASLAFSSRVGSCGSFFFFLSIDLAGLFDPSLSAGLVIDSKVLFPLSKRDHRSERPRKVGSYIDWKLIRGNPFGPRETGGPQVLSVF